MTITSRNLLFWEDYSTWSPRIEVLYPEIFNKSVIRSLLKNKPEYITTDDLRWLTPLLPRWLKEADNLRSEVLSRLCSHFTHLVAYHGCRPTDLDSYRANGITPLNIASMHDTLIRRVCSSSPLSPTKKQVQNACSAVSADYREGRIFFETSKRHLLDFCAHYLLYGSEYSVGILRSISSDPDYAQLLKLQGRPTLLTCEVPIYWLQQGAQEELAGSLIATYFKRKLDLAYAHPPRGVGFGFEIFRTLPPEFITAVDYPENLRDPIARSAA